ncbi:MAG: Heat-inducible transcription repressor HrcA [Chloroflexi bacterium ADurb.Bin360]|nr:MAG: Heat-inducible transcription repressor HrcA [Chloroflexi bacterium ADurb.Bin360]
METSELTFRQAQLLGYIVKEHIRTAAPVASRLLVDYYNLDVSPATVRNEMARLEELGYLSQPHTSAGRVPTESGFRYFVERLMEEQTLPLAEQRRIAHQFYQARDHVDEWLPLAASVLASATRSAALVTPPLAVTAKYRHIELLSTHGRAVLLVLVLEGGAVRQQALVLPEYLSQNMLSDIADRLNQLFSGLAADGIRQHLVDLAPLELDFARLVLSLMQEAKDLPSEAVYRHGLSQLLQEPEFSEGEERSQGVIRIIEEQNLLQAVIADALSPSLGIGGMRILIGGEGRWDSLRACSVILTRYGVANYATGALGVVGPVRMAYGRAISVLRFVADVLSELTYDTFSPGERDLTAPNFPLDFEEQV